VLWQQELSKNVEKAFHRAVPSIIIEFGFNIGFNRFGGK
jgi:hypothetical protein